MFLNIKKKYVIVAIIFLGLVAVITVFIRSRQSDDLRIAISKVLNRNKDQIFLNIPPFDGRYPGTLMFTPEPGKTITRIKRYHPNYIPLAVSSFRVHLDEEDKALLSGKSLGSISSSGDLDIFLQLDSLRLFEIDLDSSLKAIALEYNDLIKDQDKNPVFIYRSYEAIPTFQIRKSSKISAEAWQNMKKNSLQAGGSLNADGEIIFKNDGPVVIAYEVVKAEVLSSSLSAGKPDKVKFTEVLSSDFPSVTLNTHLTRKYPVSNGISYLCIGNSKYQSNAFGNLDFVTPSIEIVDEVIASTGASSLFPNQKKNQIISQNKLDYLISQCVEQIKKDTDSVFIFYYVGHAISGPGGQLYLVLNDYKGNPQIDLGEDIGLGLFRYQINQQSHPLLGSNFEQLLNLSNKINAEYPKTVQGLYPVHSIYKKLEATGKHFIIIIDACYDHSQMNELRQKLSLSEWGDYYGPKDFGGSQEIQTYHQAIMDFGAVDYLKSQNVVIFSSAPGSVAIEVVDPRPKFGRQTYVAPLARRLFNGLEATIGAKESITLGNWLQPMIDVRPIGMIQIKGTISWSNFDLIERIPLFRY